MAKQLASCLLEILQGIQIRQPASSSAGALLRMHPISCGSPFACQEEITAGIAPTLIVLIGSTLEKFRCRVAAVPQALRTRDTSRIPATPGRGARWTMPRATGAWQSTTESGGRELFGSPLGTILLARRAESSRLPALAEHAMKQARGTGRASEVHRVNGVDRVDRCFGIGVSIEGGEVACEVRRL